MRRTVALIMAIVGLNLITYAITRYVMTVRLLTNAQEKMNAVIIQDGLYDQAYPDGLPRHVTWALYSVGGLYHWHNDALLFSVLGGVLIVVSYVVLRSNNNQKANKPAHTTPDPL